jgi:hypothetical protein
MSYLKSFSTVLAIVVCAALVAADASAQTRRRVEGGRVVVGRAAPRFYTPRVYVPRVYTAGVIPRRAIGPRVIAPRLVGVVPYRPYFYPYRPGVTFGFYSGYPARYGYPAVYGYPYVYNSFGYPLPPPAYVTAVPGYSYGGVRIQGAPENGQVFADGYYVGVVDDFDGVFQHLNLTSGAHRIEIRAPGFPPVSFDVNVVPGETMTYHAGLR